MHELSLARRIVAIVAEHAVREPFTRASRVSLRVGELSHVEPAALAFAFQAASLGSLAEGAELRIERVPGRARCDACGGEAAVASRVDPCPRCGAFGWALIAGDEMQVTELEVT
jgi:hydrogenase nickel incorporation protein HypA/HybF